MCLPLLFLLNTTVLHANNSMCDYLSSNGYGNCINGQNLLGSEANFMQNFVKWDGPHLGNNEQQTYQPQQVIWNSSDNTVSLIAEPKKTGNFSFISGAIRTKGKFNLTKDKDHQSILRGGVEVTAKVPYNYGRWPAIWMMPYYDVANKWPSGMEIDILEFMQPPFNVTGTIHYGLKTPTGASWNYNGSEDNQASPANSIDGNWHKYGLEWNIEETKVTLTWYFDGKPYFQIEMDKKDNKYVGLMRKLNGMKETAFFCQKWTSICPSKYGITLEEATYNSFQNGFGMNAENEGYYLIINMAIGGNGVAPTPDPKTFPKTEMKILDAHRFIIGS